MFRNIGAFHKELISLYTWIGICFHCFKTVSTIYVPPNPSSRR